MTATAETLSAVPTAQIADARPLGQLRCGERGVICNMAALGDAQMQERMRQLGFVEGREVELVRRAPLGSPVVVRVCDAQICLRRAQTNLITVSQAPTA